MEVCGASCECLTIKKERLLLYTNKTKENVTPALLTTILGKSNRSRLAAAGYRLGVRMRASKTPVIEEKLER